MNLKSNSRPLNFHCYCFVITRMFDSDFKWVLFLSLSQQVQQPSLMITTGKDGLIKPQFCAKMDQWVKKTIINIIINLFIMPHLQLKIYIDL